MIAVGFGALSALVLWYMVEIVLASTGVNTREYRVIGTPMIVVCTISVMVTAFKYTPEGGTDMWAILVAAWKDLGPTGKMVVAVVVLLAGAGRLGLAMWLGYNLDWLPGLLSGG